MATYKAVKGVSHKLGGLKNLLQYVGQEKSKNERVYKTTGINCSDDFDKAFKNMVMSKQIHNKTEGRQYKHHIQSFKEGEVDPELAHKIGVEFAEKNFKNFDVFVATHTDKNHIHNHIIINSVCNKNGLKLDDLPVSTFEKKLSNLKDNEICFKKILDENDKICKKYNLSVIDREKKAESINIWDKKEYNVVKKHLDKKEESYKIKLALDFKNFAKESQNFKEFSEKFKNVGVDTKLTEKNITFVFEDEKRKSIRLKNLQKTFNENIFSKEGLENEFKRTRERGQNKEVGGRNTDLETVINQAITELSRAGRKENQGVNFKESGSKKEPQRRIRNLNSSGIRQDKKQVIKSDLERSNYKSSATNAEKLGTSRTTTELLQDIERHIIKKSDRGTDIQQKPKIIKKRDRGFER